MLNFFTLLKDPTVISLLISNILVIILSVVQKWDVSEVLWVYWMQSVIIGFFQFLRIISLKHFSIDNYKTNNQSAYSASKKKVFVAFFFLFHYGFFHFIYAIFLFNFFTNQALDYSYLFIGGLIFFLNHLFSFMSNKIIDGQKTQNIGQLIFSPYARIIPMHLIIIFGAILGQSTLIIFLLLKTITDLLMHNFKHMEALNLLSDPKIDSREYLHHHKVIDHQYNLPKI